MPLRYLFLDMNSFFASVEQQEHPQLQGQPVGVVPVLAWNSSCIAASYEAKAYGVKTGTSVVEAKRLCRNIRFALARPKLYVEYHHRIIDVVEDCIHIEKVCSIDEMYARLYNNEREISTIQEIAQRIKSILRQKCGTYIRCSIGIAPNIWLAKTATNLQKPDGFTIIHESNAEEKVSKLALTDLTGIGRGMSQRLRARGIRTVKELYALSERELSSLWGSKLYGREWWQKLRGYDLFEKATQRRTVSHSHVLPPQFRSIPDAYAVSIHMLHKAAYRLRRLGYCAERLTCNVKFLQRDRFVQSISCHPVRDTITLIQIFNSLWQDIPQQRPLKVAVILSNLIPDRAVSLSLFAHEEKYSRIADTMDRINTRYGINTIYLAPMHRYQMAAPTRISFTQIPDLKDFK